jgi:lauroyl/myristoyl acyltransferase
MAAKMIPSPAAVALRERIGELAGYLMPDERARLTRMLDRPDLPDAWLDAIARRVREVDPMAGAWSGGAAMTSATPQRYVDEVA